MFKSSRGAASDFVRISIRCAVIVVKHDMIEHDSDSTTAADTEVERRLRTLSTRIRTRGDTRRASQIMTGYTQLDRIEGGSLL